MIVIGGEPKMRDPASGPLATPDAVLLTNVAQGLVRFDASGNIVGGLAERWNVSDDGLSYIFRLASAEWPDGRKITAEQVAKILKRNVAPRSRNPIKDTLGAIDDIVAMTDRVIEIRLAAPRPSLLALLAQPEMAIVRGRFGTGPFSAAPDAKEAGWLRLTRKIAASDDEETQTRRGAADWYERGRGGEELRIAAMSTWYSAARSRICRSLSGPNCRATASASIRPPACSASCL